MLYGLIFLPMAAAPMLPLAGRRSKKLRNALAIATCAVVLGLAVLLLFLPEQTGALKGVAGLGLALETGGFRKVYLTVIAFLWLLTTLFGSEYFAHYQNTDRYYCCNLLTLGALNGVFSASDLFTALVFFEIMSFTSYVWVLQEETPAALRAANTYLAVAVIGGLVALMGLFLLWKTLGTTTISALYEAAAASDQKAVLYAAGGCVLFGFGAKAGMFPLHIWLPKAHPVAPAPASALLSGLLTKSGVFGVLVLSCDLFRDDPVWGTVVLTLGAITMLLGAVLALLSVDLKRTLACSSVSQIGFILTGIGTMGILGTENALAARGVLLHMVNHSLFKLVLFLAAGAVYCKLHKLNLNDIRGFGRKKPALLIPFLLAALGIGGFPLLNGYVSKTLLHEGIVEAIEHLAAHGGFALGMRAVEWVFLLSGGITVAYMTKLFVALFLEKHPTRQAEFDGMRAMNAQSAAALWIGALVLPVLGLTMNRSMNAIADFGTDFLHAAALEHAVRYLSWENLKGGLISIGIGFALYFGVVRTVLMGTESGVRVYRNRLPAWLDLEELLYRPLLLRWLPGLLYPVARLFGENRVTAPLCRGVLFGASAVAKVFGENRVSAPLCRGVLFGASAVAETFGENRVSAPLCRALRRGAEVVSHAASDSLDAIVLLLRRTVFRDSVPKPDDRVQSALSYRAGAIADRRAIRRGVEEAGENRHALQQYRAQRALRQKSRRVTASFSFALLMLVLAVCAMFGYILFIR